MIKVSHEMPLSLLRDGYDIRYNDYSYALVHLFEENSDYFKHFVNSLRAGRQVYLDNSIFELGEAFDTDRFVYWLNRLLKESGSNNIVYIVPDVLDNTALTISNAVNFMQKYPSLPGKRMMVAQGKSLSELQICYTVLSQFCDIVGISFNCLAYEAVSVSHTDHLITWMKGRHHFLETLYNLNLIQPNIHLLGCALPQEFKYYTQEHKELSNYIISLDTSNPIVHGIRSILYTEQGLFEKESIKLCDLLHYIPTSSEKLTIDQNLRLFREINSL